MKTKDEILKGLTLCTYLTTSCAETDCPYYEDDIFNVGSCVKALHEDVIEYILVGAEPTQKDELHFYCGRCGLSLRLKLNLKYCPRCGVKIKWPTGYTNGSMMTSHGAEMNAVTQNANET